MTTITPDEAARRLGVHTENVFVFAEENIDDDHPKKPLARLDTRQRFFSLVKQNNTKRFNLPCATLLRQNGFASKPIAYSTFKDRRSLCRVLSSTSLSIVPMQGELRDFDAWLDEEGIVNGALRNEEAEALIGDMVFHKVYGDVLLTRKTFDPSDSDFVRRFKSKTTLCGYEYGSDVHIAWMRAMSIKHNMDYDEDNHDLHEDLEEAERDWGEEGEQEDHGGVHAAKRREQDFIDHEIDRYF